MMHNQWVKAEHVICGSACKITYIAAPLESIILEHLIPFTRCKGWGTYIFFEILYIALPRNMLLYRGARNFASIYNASFMLDIGYKLNNMQPKYCSFCDSMNFGKLRFFSSLLDWRWSGYLL